MSVPKVFEDMKNLTVHELYVYQLIKFVCKSVNKLSNIAFVFKKNMISIPVKNVLKVLDCSLLQFHPSDQRSFSLKHRGSILLNFLSRKGLLSKNFVSKKDGEVTDFVHTFRDLYIHSNIELVKFVFER